MKRLNRERNVEQILAETNRKLTKTNNVLVKLEQEAIEQSKIANDISRLASRSSILALIIALISIIVAISSFIINDLREEDRISFDFLLANRDKAIDYIDNTKLNIFELNYACEEINALVVKGLSESSIDELNESTNYIYESYGVGLPIRRKLQLLLSGHNELTNWIEERPFLTTTVFGNALRLITLAHLMKHHKGKKISSTRLNVILQGRYSSSNLEEIIEMDQVSSDEMKKNLDIIYEVFLINQIVLDGVEEYLYKLSFSNVNEDDTKRMLSESVESTLDYFADYDVTSSVCSVALSSAVENLRSKLPVNSVQGFY
ncbi:hypothetical protein OAY_06790 [Vibrio cyclitrophicus ZF205]|uniref:hypothetical protein n=1 Tax=Vibrio cyclitrophicus TaxID=47951 RepID=UPI0002DBCB00|nr:hypothetical protein [Vibrio cyclitrophicus]OEE14488.1 hypothetical protein OAY_06790 [Vibrio cyclitrophicus ZF205]